MRLDTLTSHRVAVTGASSGLGRAASLQLAEQGARVTALARGADALADLAAFDSRIESRPLDLTDAHAVATWAGETDVEGVVLNAGATRFGDFLEQSDADDAALVSLNVTANLRLARALAARWTVARRPGRILVVASLGGFAPLPRQAVYGASKAFLISWGLALREELAAHAVTVGVFAPGGIATPMTAGAEFDGLRAHLALPEDVAAALVQAYCKGAPLTVPGTSNRLAALAAKLAPAPLSARVAAKLYSR